jgi:hypothetical protein
MCFITSCRIGAIHERLYENVNFGHVEAIRVCENACRPHRLRELDFGLGSEKDDRPVHKKPKVIQF